MYGTINLFNWTKRAMYITEIQTKWSIKLPYATAKINKQVENKEINKN